MAIKLIHTDFLMKNQHDIGEVDLIVADPPDNIGLKYDGFNDRIDNDIYKSILSDWIMRMVRIANGCPIFLTFNEKWTLQVEEIIGMYHIPLIQRIQWFYTFGQDQTKRSKYSLCYRPIYWLNSDFCDPKEIKIPSAREAKYNDKRAASGGKMPPNVWEFSRICGTFKERRKWSPTQLPEALVERILKGHCPKGGRVFDPFVGSGTTAIVCQRLGLDFVGTEISEPTIKKTAEHLGVSYE